MTSKIAKFFLFIILASATYTYAETVKLNVTRDVWLSAYPGEENFNMGVSPKLKLKGIQEMAILDFDLSQLKGKKIESARLYICNAAKNNKLRRIGISTVASDWVEGSSRDYSIDKIGKGAAFLYSSYKEKRWAGEGSDLTDVTMGSGNTRQHHTELRRENGMWWSVDIDPELLYALILNKSHGLLVMDESGQTMVNNFIYSKESKDSLPYLEVAYSKAGTKKPQKLDAKLLPSPENAHMESGALVLRVPIKEDIFAFDVFINDKEAPLWRIPKPGPVNSVQEIIIDWLPPEKKTDIKIMAVNELGQRSEPVSVSGYASKALSRIAIHNTPTPLDRGEDLRKATLLRVWALPDIVKIDPVSGNVLSETVSSGFDHANTIWTESKKEINLVALRGEVIGFQLCIESGNKLFDELEIKMPELASNNKKLISAKQFSMYQVHYLKVKEKWYPEIAIPMKDGKIIMKAEQRPVKDQKNQLIYIDLSIPSQTDAGLYKGDILVLGNGIVEETLHIDLKVADVLMPKKLSFVPELNMYNGPDKAGTERFYQAHQIAREHRTVINRVPYNQNGTVHNDMIPKISYSNDGKVEIDWTDYDRRLGPLFDGSVFSAGERRGMPVEKFYLPFFENWPAQLAPNYNYGYEGAKTKEAISKHAMDAPPVNDAFTSKYRENFIEVVKKFKKHFEDKGWDQPEFQFYLNNKPRWKGSSSWWDLDEPVSYDDWMALKFYGSLFKQATVDTPLKFIFRADISRPRWQHDWLNGLLDRMYVQDEAFYNYTDKVRQMKKTGKINYSVYGSLNNIESSNQNTVFWCVRSFAEGADGVLPWQSLGGAKAFTIPDRNALIIDAREQLDIDWVVSLRVKALRRGQQDAELLGLIEKKYGYNREQIRDLVNRYFETVKLSGNNDDMNTTIDTARMDNFRKILIEMLEHERNR
jgi:hypothetical protein